MQIETDLSFPMHAAPEKARERWDKRIIRRLRKTRLSLLVFQLLLQIVYFLGALDGNIEAIKNYGIVSWLAWFLPPTVFIPIICIFVVQACTEDTDELIGRPVWFLFIITLAVTLGTISLELFYSIFFSIQNEPKFIPFPFVQMIRSVLLTLVLQVPFNWLALLYQRYTDNQKKIGPILTRRALLARQVAQSRLLTARAEIDPKLIINILREVQARYHIDATGASTLLDQLIAYLRLAMNRSRDKAPSFSAECALINAYLTLRDAETGVPITLDIDDIEASQKHATAPLPLFLIVQKMFDEAVLTPALSVRIGIALRDGQLSITLDTGHASISEQGQARLAENIGRLALKSTNKFTQSFDLGANRYVVQAPIDGNTTHSYHR